MVREAGSRCSLYGELHEVAAYRAAIMGERRRVRIDATHRVEKARV
jgi:hypothetical protein